MTDYEYLSRAVTPLLPGDPGRATAGARAAVADWATTTMRAVADGGHPVRAILHPLGFTCLPVERSGRDGVCVHLWSPQVERAALTTSGVHAHCWELASYVLFGRLENQVMGVADAGPDERAAPRPISRENSGLYRVLDVRTHGEVDELVPTHRVVRCVPGARQVVAAGDAYALPAGVFHTTEIPVGTEAATVALGQFVPGAPDWSLGPPGSGSHRVRRGTCDAGQTAAIARIILGHLMATTSCPA